ncbi:MAG: TonB-dependent receptor [Gammaproteobacteria bacterium]|nr:TonB-dependent receptor [Gammaproteobacteria bacterium]
MTTNQRFIPLKLSPLAVAVALSGAALVSTGSQAQESSARASSAMLEEVVVTARKREEGAQEVPLSVTAYNADQIDALKVRSLTNLSIGMPNVSLEDVGTTRGTANFSIRGLGINSSIPTIDPTVGVFQNGVYVGTNQGILFDMFDVASIEVLRGPQGTLFGRNVTGGAVLVNHKKPGDEFEASLRYALETGDIGGYNSYYMGSVGGPITDTLGGRIVAYYNDDEGQFENDFTGNDHGEIEQQMVRGTLVWEPTDTLEFVLRYEYGDVEGDGPAAQSHTNGTGVPGQPVNNDRDSFDFSIDETGFQENETNFITGEVNWDVGFGDGTVTNIFGYRSYEATSLSDIDAQPVWLFHAPAWLETEQVSNELRYTGLFAEKANVTAGVYYYQNDLDYHERRELLGSLTGNVGPALQLDGGGTQETTSFTAFAQVDYDLNESWTLTAGVNYSYEEKEAELASLIENQNSPCNIVEGPVCPYDFVDDDDWSNIAPKLGATYNIDDDSRVYTSWTRGYRSGGYNLRNTSAANKPEVFDEEEVNNYEVGYKSNHAWGRLNAAVFYNEVSDMQRELNFPNEGAGTVQFIRNTADATIFGAEVDGVFPVTDNFVILASIGYIDAEYDEVSEDLNGDGVVDGADKSLDLPRAPELTYSIGGTYDIEISNWGFMTARLNYAYRDEMAYTDSNLGFINEVDMLDAGLDFQSNSGEWMFSLYGRNLLDEVSHGGDTQLPDTIGPVPTGGTFSPLTPGIRVGLEVTYNFM